MSSKCKKITSPCFYVKLETDYKLRKLQKITNISRSILAEIAIGALNEKELQNGELRGYSSEIQKQQQTLFDF